MKKLVVGILIILFSLTSCGKQPEESDYTDQTHQMTQEEKIEQMLKSARIDKIIESGRDYVGNDEFQLETIDDSDYSGEYLDYQGTSDIYSSLILSHKDGVKYNCEVSLYRLTSFNALAISLGDGELYFESEPSDTEPYTTGFIRINGDTATLKLTYSEFSESGGAPTFEFQNYK